MAFPLAEATEGFGAMWRLIDEFGLAQAVLLGSFEFVFQVTQRVRPAALVGHPGPEPAQGLDQTGLAVGDDQFQRLAAQTTTP